MSYYAASGVFRFQARLTAFRVRAQHRSYTNKVTGPRGSGSDRRLLDRRLVHDRCDRRRWRQDPLRCLSGDVLHQAGRGGRLRPLCQSRWRTGARRSAYRAGADGIAWRTAGAVPGRRRLGRQDRPRAQRVRHRDRRRHHLSRLQAGALHRVLGGRRRRHGHGRDRGHLQLLRRQGEDRHRPLSRSGDGDRSRARRGDRPRHDQRIRLADAVARRRASSDRRLQEGRPRHLRRADGPLQLQAGRTDDRRRRHRGGAGRLSAHRQRRGRRAHAGRLRLGDHRHVRQAMARQGRRSRGGRRPHHRRSVASIRPASCSIFPIPGSR